MRPSRYRLHCSLAATAVLLSLTLARESRALFDLTGNWIETWGGQSVPVRIIQNGASLRYGYSNGTIDLESGAFDVVFYHAPACPGPFVLHGQLIDADHFRGEIGGWVPAFASPCRPVGGLKVVGERVQPRTPIPSPSRSPTTSASPTPTSSSSPIPTSSASPIPTSSPSPTPTMTLCAGDCDGSGSVTVNELTLLVSCLSPIGLDIVRPCPSFECADANGNGTIEINELVTAVNNLLRGCP